MDLTLIGLSHHTAPVEVRERFHFAKYDVDHYLGQLAQKESTHSALVLSTCNRIEIYSSGEDAERLLRDTENLLLELHQVRNMDLRGHLYRRQNLDAAKHLFRVASSLDSMIVGEPQILGQVKDAYLASRNLSFLDPFLERLLQRALYVAKKVRTETKIGEQAVSISYAAVNLAEKIFGSLQGRNVLIIGAGEMADLAARHLRSAGIAEMFFANRTYDRSVEMAKQFSGMPMHFDQISPSLYQADIVIASTAATEPILGLEDVQRALEARKNEPILLVDISVPRNIDSNVETLEDAYLYNIDDLQGVISSNLEQRMEEARKAEAIVQDEVIRFYHRLDEEVFTPTLDRLHKKYRKVQERELSRLRSRLSSCSEKEIHEIEKSMDVLIRRILRDPIHYLKEGISSGENSDRSTLLRHIFGLSKDDEEGL